MPSVQVIDVHGQKVGSVELQEAVFGVPPAAGLVHEAVVMQRACERQGTAATRTRGEVSGSGKKPWKQKHTGRARAGSIRSPLWRHGGTVFGPKTRSYVMTMPKKKYRAALQSALSAKLADGGLTVVSDLVIAEPKTKLLAKVLAGLGLPPKTLIVAGESRHDLARAARNLRDVKLVRPEALNVYDVLRYDAVLIPERELARVKEAWS